MVKESTNLRKTSTCPSFVGYRNRCFYCGDTKGIMEADHIVAKSKGGRTVVPACRSCNASKGDKQLMDWFRWLKQNDSERWILICNEHKGRRNKISKKVHKIRDKR